jgi:hypothetical protein
LSDGEMRLAYPNVPGVAARNAIRADSESNVLGMEPYPVNNASLYRTFPASKEQAAIRSTTHRRQPSAPVMKTEEEALGDKPVDLNTR